MSARLSCDYSFSDDEIRPLLLLLRKNEAVLDGKLDAFYAFLERIAYGDMTIEEAEEFFK